MDQFEQMQYMRGEIQHHMVDESKSDSDIEELEQATERERQMQDVEN